MAWLLPTLCAILIYSSVQLVDKFALDKIFQNENNWLFLAGLFGIFPLSGALYINGGFSEISMIHASILILSGMLQMVSYKSYAIAIKETSADMVSTFFQMMPVYALIFGLLFLDDVMTAFNIVGVLIVCLSALYLCKPAKKRFAFTKVAFKPFLLMQLTCVLLATSGFLIDSTTTHVSHLDAVIYIYMGMLLFTAFFGLYCKKSINITRPFKNSAFITFTILAGVEIAESLSAVLSFEAYSHGPYSAIVTLSAIEPFIVLLLMITICGFFPHYKKEAGLNMASLSHKIPAFIGVIIGVGLIV